MVLSVRLVLNTFAQLIGKFATTATTLFIIFLITQNLGDRGLGTFAVITSYVALFYIIADFGLNAVLIKEIAREPEKTTHYFNNLLTLRIFLSILLAFVAISILSFLPYNSEIKLGIILGTLTILTSGIFTTANSIFQEKLRYDKSTIADFLGALTTLALSYLVLSAGASVIWVIGAYVLGGITRIVSSLLFASSYLQNLRISFDFNLWQRLLILALPLGITTILSQVNANIDKIIVSLVKFSPNLNLNNIEATGAYGLSYRIFEVSLVLPTYALNAAYPILVRHKLQGYERLKDSSRKLIISLFILANFFLIIGFFLAPYIINFFPGRESVNILGSTTALRILLFALPIFYVSAPLFWLVVTLDQQKFLGFIFGFSALVNIFLNIVFVPKYGYTAAAFVTIITEGLILGLLTLVVSKGFRDLRRGGGVD